MVDYQKCRIEDYNELAKEGKVEFERVCKYFVILNNKVLGEEFLFIFVNRNHDVIRPLYSNFQRSLFCQDLIATLFSNLVNKLGFEEPLLIGLCPFCGLGFTPLWVGKIISCKHVYHCWCVDLCFSNSTKWIQIGCVEDMHEA